MQKMGISLLAMAAVALMSLPTSAQSDTSTAKADIVFEMQPAKLVGSELGKKFGWKQMLDQQGAAMAAQGDPDFGKVVKVFAGIQSPDNMEDIQKLQMGQGDIQFFVQVEFADAESATTMLKKPMEDNGGVIEKNGKKYYKAPEGQGVPNNTVAYQVDEKTIAMASDGFAYNSSMAISAGALKSWKAMPEEAIRLTIDGVQARDFMKSLAEEGKKNAPTPMVNAFFDLLPGMDSISLSIDLSSKNLLTMNAVGADQEKGSDMGDALQGLLTLGIGPAKQQLGALKQQDAESAAVLMNLLDGINVKKDDRSVVLSIPRPEGFEDTVERMFRTFAPMLRMLMPGMGGGAGAPGMRPAGPPRGF
jgi:hypothetical protein